MTKLALEWFLGDNLLKRSYSRLLTVGTFLGVTAVIVVLTLFANYYRAVEDTIMGVNPHISIVKEAFSSADIDFVRDLMAGYEDEVVAWQPAVELTTSAVVSSVEPFGVQCTSVEAPSVCFDPLLRAPREGEEARLAEGYRIKRVKASNLRLRGIEVHDGRSLMDLSKVMDVKAGERDLDRLVAENMKMGCIFDRSFFHGASKLDDFLVTLPGQQDEGPFSFRLLTTLNLGTKRSEHPVFITSLANVRRILQKPDFINSVDIRLRDPHQAQLMSSELAGRLAARGMRTRSWIDLDEGSFRLLRTLKLVILVVVFSVLVVAALSITSALSLTVMQNKRKIAILRSMGFRDLNIYRMLLLKCGRIGTMGLTTGLAGGYLVSLLLLAVPGIRTGLSKLGVRNPEIHFEAGDLALLALATLLLYIIVALVPARAACRIDPVEGLQA